MTTKRTTRKSTAPRSSKKATPRAPRRRTLADDLRDGAAAPAPSPRAAVKHGTAAARGIAFNARREGAEKREKEVEALLAEAAILAGEDSGAVAAVRDLPPGLLRLRAARRLVEGLRRREMVRQEKPAAKAGRRRPRRTTAAAADAGAVETLNRAPLAGDGAPAQEDEVQVSPPEEPAQEAPPTEDLAQEAPPDEEPELSAREKVLIATLWPGNRAGITVTRQSVREFDVAVRGPGFRAWLPLVMIRELPWTADRIAHLTDYPEMAASGDWSGVRDSSKAAKWLIFEGEVDGFLGPVPEGRRTRGGSRSPAPASRAAEALAGAPAPAARRGGAAAPGAVLGHSPSAAIRWMGARGWTMPEVLAVLAALGVHLLERSVYFKWLEGRNREKRALAGKRDAVAAPTPEQAGELEALRAAPPPRASVAA